MDDIVKQALAKWPNVPACTGWLMLDRRGQWRMRDEAAQASGSPGTPIRHEALLGFINRNYERDERGQWFFQNGPQRVYVELGYTPWVVRLSVEADGALALKDQVGNGFEPSAVFADDEGGILFAGASDPGNPSAPPRIAVLHDHDLEVFADHATLADDSLSGEFHWNGGVTLPLQPIRSEEVASRFGFVASPAAMV
ncbi:DUF2946 domain-containing protein [Paraburkholderia graminis]|jgi:hypothetical protein|uniref:DUF2946 family protein n=1 Tax=Paraburkholderia graminis (strain ATCC 700544 / DSM 17151 / LMG 18924 / NCIMB 13744 / C4D1M) TaxID=396598 RepID=B1G208_PARG4|nr:DUF2946 family protein [Paraburkholderia graminis]AXF09046.1 DUF2946 domain-containing protein [Paraburkholderia graminis]EDT09758.1 conserved hypothetical protein [Paraburkholderia graminis C4D1M]MDR6468003.1 hypothetical protein [Paraburkholderia graminis]MDR6472727.1 hypothetical protein [Paraburkholderia graminis]CAB3701781.1 hypothetical protein R8871_03604 [Paraburkholderia graminis C4D1M]